MSNDRPCEESAVGAWRGPVKAIAIGRPAGISPRSGVRAWRVGAATDRFHAAAVSATLSIELSPHREPVMSRPSTIFCSMPMKPARSFATKFLSIIESHDIPRTFFFEEGRFTPRRASFSAGRRRTMKIRQRSASPCPNSQFSRCSYSTRSLPGPPQHSQEILSDGKRLSMRITYKIRATCLRHLLITEMFHYYHSRMKNEMNRHICATCPCHLPRTTLPHFGFFRSFPATSSRTTRWRKTWASFRRS